MGCRAVWVVVVVPSHILFFKDFVYRIPRGFALKSQCLADPSWLWFNTGWPVYICRFMTIQKPIFRRKKRKRKRKSLQKFPLLFARVFWVNIGLILQNLKLICVIETVQTYLGFGGERLNFGITVAEIQPKVWERRRKRWREKMLNFDNGDTEFPVPNSAARVHGVPEVKRKKILTN